MPLASGVISNGEALGRRLDPFTKICARRYHFPGAHGSSALAGQLSIPSNGSDALMAMRNDWTSRSRTTLIARTIVLCVDTVFAYYARLNDAVVLSNEVVYSGG